MSDDTAAIPDPFSVNPADPEKTSTRKPVDPRVRQVREFVERMRDLSPDEIETLKELEAEYARSLESFKGAQLRSAVREPRATDPIESLHLEFMDLTALSASLEEFKQASVVLWAFLRGLLDEHPTEMSYYTSKSRQVAWSERDLTDEEKLEAFVTPRHQ